MNVLITPNKQISGEVLAPPSKSYAHRYIISAFLSKQAGFIKNVGNCKDVLATLTALSSVGLNYSLDASGVEISFKDIESKPILNCFESGSTLRFLIPIMSALGIKCEFKGSEKLLSRPILELTQCLNENGAEINGFKLNGKLRSGEFKLNGSISSQFISGLLFALPLLNGDSKIVILGETVSLDYINITLSVLKDFNIEVEKTDYGYFIKGNQTYVMPSTKEVEGDYSGASFLMALGALSAHGVKVLGLNKETSQGDKKIANILKQFGAYVEEIDYGYFIKKGELKGITVDMENLPDIVQILSVVASFSSGVTTFKNVSRLKIKESDRIEGIIKNLSLAGIKAEYNGADLIIFGGEPKGAVFFGDNDHRTIMSMAVLATFSKGSSQIIGAEAVDKSYTDFFKDYISLGGIVDGAL